MTPEIPTPFAIALPSDILEEEAAFFADPSLPGGRFGNPWGAVNDKGLMDVLRWRLSARDSAFRAAKRQQAPSLPVASDPAGRWSSLPAGARVQWLGHATILVELDGLTFLVDPLFGRAGPVVPRAVPAPRLPDSLPRIDAVLVSHGHYDHLDRPSLAAVAERWPEALFVVPQGQAASLPARCRRVVSLTWWQAVRLEGVQITLVPAQHWHRRGAFDQDRALWGGWHLQGTRSLYHSGDTGYFGGFRAIQRALGAVDVAVLPLGAYEPRWFMGMQHMSPEDSLQAWHDLGAQHFVGMHWGTYDLTDEPLDHGAFTLLPQIAAARDLPLDRLHILAHGGALGFLDPLAPEPSARISPSSPR